MDVPANIKVSVVVPVYNVELYLDRCVESIVGQTHLNLEVLLVDDGSSDCSGLLCDKWAHRDNRVQVIHKENGGLSSARNAGIDRASGTFFVFVDGDDYLEPGMIEDLVGCSIATEAELCLTGYHRVDDGRRILTSVRHRRALLSVDDFWLEAYGEAAHEVADRAFYVVAWNKLYHKRLFDDVRYEIGKIHEDEFILHQIVRQCNRIAISDGCNYDYVQRDNSIMHSETATGALDAVEAFLRRADYFREAGLSTAFTGATFDAMRSLAIAHYLSKDDGEACRFSRLENDLKLMVSTRSELHLPIKALIKTLIFKFNSNLYYAIWRRRNVVRDSASCGD